MRSLLVLALLLGACGGIDELDPLGPGPSGGKADSLDNVPPELLFATRVRAGDIILTSSDPERGCWYLNSVENWALDPRYCHAALVTEKVGLTGITTIEALNEGQDIRVLEHQEHSLAYDMETKLVVLRVVDDEAKLLSQSQISAVVAQALEWKDVEYKEPPISLHGDPRETGLYCSMLPYRAYLDAAGIDLDSYSPPFIVTPDELYSSSNTRVVLESAPKDPAPEGTPVLPDEPPADEPDGDSPPHEEPPDL